MRILRFLDFKIRDFLRFFEIVNQKVVKVLSPLLRNEFTLLGAI